MRPAWCKKRDRGGWAGVTCPVMYSNAVQATKHRPTSCQARNSAKATFPSPNAVEATRMGNGALKPFQLDRFIDMLPWWGRGFVVLKWRGGLFSWGGEYIINNLAFYIIDGLQRIPARWTRALRSAIALIPSQVGRPTSSRKPITASQSWGTRSEIHA